MRRQTIGKEQRRGGFERRDVIKNQYRHRETNGEEKTGRINEGGSGKPGTYFPKTQEKQEKEKWGERGGGKKKEPKFMV